MGQRGAQRFPISAQSGVKLVTHKSVPQDGVSLVRGMIGGIM